MLVSSIFSTPVKADWAAVRRAPAKMANDAISINGLMSGRWKMFVARKPESKNEIKESDKPRASSKISPAIKMFFTFDGLFSELYCATYFIIAAFIPQSLNIIMRFGAVKAIVYMPYSEGDSSLATIITYTAGMIVEVARPQKRWNPPLAETLAISAALLTEPSS